MSEILKTAFAKHLQSFNDLTSDMPPKEKIKKKLLEIKAAAEGDPELTYRQKQAISGRVDNYLKDDYFPRSRTPQQGKLSRTE